MTKPQRAAGASQVEENVRLVAKMIMAARGVRPAELALRLGVSRTAMFNRLGGVKPFTVAEVGIMAEFLDVPPAVFLAGPNVMIGSGRASNTGDYRTRTPGVSPVARAPYARLRAVA